MRAESGESTVSINRRGDLQAWPDVLAALRDGATLRVHHVIRRVEVEGLPDPRDRRAGRTISFGLVRHLVHQGALSPCGVDRYMLTPGWDEPA